MECISINPSVILFLLTLGFGCPAWSRLSHVNDRLQVSSVNEIVYLNTPHQCRRHGRSCSDRGRGVGSAAGMTRCPHTWHHQAKLYLHPCQSRHCAWQKWPGRSPWLCKPPERSWCPTRHHTLFPNGYRAVSPLGQSTGPRHWQALVMIHLHKKYSR